MKMKYEGKRIDFREFADKNAIIDYLDESNPDGIDTLEYIPHADLEPVGIDYDDLYCYEFVKVTRKSPNGLFESDVFFAHPAKIDSMFDINPIMVVEYVNDYPVKNPAWQIKKPFAGMQDCYITFNDSINKCKNLVELFELIKDDTITGDELEYDARANLWFIKDDEN